MSTVWREEMFQIFVVLVVVYVVFFSDVSCSNDDSQHGAHINNQLPLRYSRVFLLRFSTLTDTRGLHDIDFPSEIKMHTENTQKERKRGRRSGVRKRLKRLEKINKTRLPLPLPTMALANTRSLRETKSNHNMDELRANVRYFSDFRNACLISLVETWWDENTPENSTHIDGFGLPYRADRNKEITGKSGGGGAAIYVNERWCKKSQVVVRERICMSDIELISLSCRPFYLPREFGQIFITCVYIHPRANKSSALETIADCVHRLKTVSPDDPNFVMGDFNRADLNIMLPSLEQYVTCSTRQNSTLDMCYGNIARAYKAVQKAPNGTSDHNVVLLQPIYVQKLRREKTQTREIPVWSRDTEEHLAGSFACTDWNVLTADADVSQAAEVVSDYINFNKDMIIPKKKIKIYANNKPWITKRLKTKIIEKNTLFAEGKRAKGRILQSEIKREIRREKLRLRERVEEGFCTGNVRDAWRGLKTLAGKGEVKTKDDGMTDKERKDQAEGLNDFYCRFEKADFSKERKDICDSLLVQAGGEEVPLIEAETVERIFRRVNPTKAQGPDEICGRLIKTCSKELSEVFCTLFNRSLEAHSIPALWKSSIICPVPKKPCPLVLNDYRPIALTSVVMKCFERIVLCMLKNQTQSMLDVHQFAYRHNRSVDDAVLSLLHYTHSHLDQGGSYVRLLYVDFSSAFNTVQTHLLAKKLSDMNINPHLTLWLSDFLTDRTQAVRYLSLGPSLPSVPAVSASSSSSSSPSSSVCLSSLRHINTGTPQGTVISPFIFILYTNDCRSIGEKTKIIKFSDDTVLVDLSESQSEFEREVRDFVTWCETNYLEMNVSKTREMVVDFKKKKTDIPPLVVHGETVERVGEYRYLGTVVDDQLTFKVNTDRVYKKCRQRMHMLYQLRAHSISSCILERCYRAFIESILTFSFICWYGCLGVRERERLNRVVNVCSKIVGTRQASLTELYAMRIKDRATKIQCDLTHVLAKYFENLPSGRRLRVPKCRTNRFQHTFVPTAVSLLNALK